MKRNGKKTTVSKKAIKVFKVHVNLDENIFYTVKAMAESDCRSISQQILFLMLLGKDFLSNANGIVTRFTSDNRKEDSELESAIGFKVE